MKSKVASNRLFLFRMIPLMLVVCFIGWCSTANRTRQEQMPIGAELIELFRENGVLDATSQDPASAAKNLGETGMNRLLYLAAPTASLPVLKWLVAHGAEPRNVGALQDLTLMQMAAQSGKHDKLDYFLGFGLDPLGRTADGRSLMHLASEGGLDEATLQWLTSKGLKVNDITHDGSTPLHMAALKSVSTLLRAGADLNAQNHQGRTPLHEAVLREDHPVVSELIRQGASVFTADKEGRTPLHLAAMRHSESVVDSLLSAGAMKATRDAHDLTPRELGELTRKNESSRRYDGHSIIDKL